MTTEIEADLKPQKPSIRARTDQIKAFRCKNLISVLENPSDMTNIGTVIRNVNALGVEKVYVVDHKRALPDNSQKSSSYLLRLSACGRGRRVRVLGAEIMWVLLSQVHPPVPRDRGRESKFS